MRKFEHDSKVVELRKQGYSFQQVADELGICHTTAIQAAKRMNQKLTADCFTITKQLTDWTPLKDITPQTGKPGHSAFTADEAAKIRKFYQDNQRLRASWIASFLGVHQNIIYRILRKETSYTRPGNSQGGARQSPRPVSPDTHTERNG